MCVHACALLESTTFPQCEFWESNSGCQTWQPSHPEPSYQLRKFLFCTYCVLAGEVKMRRRCTSSQLSLLLKDCVISTYSPVPMVITSASCVVLAAALSGDHSPF